MPKKLPRQEIAKLQARVARYTEQPAGRGLDAFHPDFAAAASALNAKGLLTSAINTKLKRMQAEAKNAYDAMRAIEVMGREIWTELDKYKDI